MNLQLDHFSDASKNTLKNKTRGGAHKKGASLTKKNNKLFCRLTLKKRFFGVEHGSHNVSRWMTWLSISLKNAAACDKWYQLQNHFITESLNANGAWEKPFVGHPRACHTQCRTKQKRKEKKKGKGKRIFFFLLLLFSLFLNKSPSSGEASGAPR